MKGNQVSQQVSNVQSVSLSVYKFCYVTVEIHARLTISHLNVSILSVCCHGF